LVCLTHLSLLLQVLPRMSKWHLRTKEDEEEEEILKKEPST
jgi:hypothetical protein